METLRTISRVSFVSVVFVRNTPRLKVCLTGLSRNKAEEIVGRMKLSEDQDKHAKDMLLIRCFILEQMTFYKRYCLSKIAFQFHDVSPELIDPYSWLAAWTFVLLSLAFFLTWLLFWAARNAGSTMSSWGFNFLIGFLQDVFFVQIAKICVIYVAGYNSLKPQLRTILQVLGEVAMRYEDELATKYHDNEVRVVQHLSAACRASRHPVARGLPSSKILRMLNDVDIARCQENKTRDLGIIATTLIIIPSVLALISDDLSSLVSTVTTRSLPLPYRVIVGQQCNSASDIFWVSDSESSPLVVLEVPFHSFVLRGRCVRRVVPCFQGALNSTISLQSCDIISKEYLCSVARRLSSEVHPLAHSSLYVSQRNRLLLLLRDLEICV